MVKYVNTEVVFEEIPDEITLAINVSNCPNHCPGCHSPYLREDIGDTLYGDVLERLVNNNDGITCICFMGEGRDEESLINLIEFIRYRWGKTLKIALYTGGEKTGGYMWDNLDYIKLGPYIEEKGPLNKETTNQRLYKKIDGKWEDITYRFWNRK